MVTGAAGGVGSVAIALLANLGYEVTAVTGRPQEHDYLRSLGASAFLSREEMSEAPKPLETETWAGAVDAVGSTMLAKVLAQTKYQGTVTACGLAGGSDLPTHGDAVHPARCSTAGHRLGHGADRGIARPPGSRLVSDLPTACSTRSPRWSP